MSGSFRQSDRALSCMKAAAAWGDHAPKGKSQCGDSLLIPFLRSEYESFLFIRQGIPEKTDPADHADRTAEPASGFGIRG